MRGHSATWTTKARSAVHAGTEHAALWKSSIVRSADFSNTCVVMFVGKMCLFLIRSIKRYFSVENGETPNWVVDFLVEEDTFREQIMDIVEDVVEKVATLTANPGNRHRFFVRSHKPWISSKISHFSFFYFSGFILPFT